MSDIGFLTQNFGPAVGTYECYLPFCECRWGGGSTWRWWGHLNTRCCNQTWLPSHPCTIMPFMVGTIRLSGTGKPSWYLVIVTSGERVQGWEGTKMKGQEGARVGGHKAERVQGQEGTRLRGHKVKGCKGRKVRGWEGAWQCPLKLILGISTKTL